MNLLGMLLAALIGLSLGVMGGGGSILTVPIFVYVLGYGAKQAIAMSLPVVGVTSLVGAAMHWRAGNVALKPALLVGVAAMAGAYLGARLAVFLTGGVQLIMLAVIMLLAAGSMLRSGRQRPTSGQGDEAPAGAPAPALMIAAGLGVGVLTGIVGIGGGFLIVPALVIPGRVPMKQAVGTSLLVIAMNSAAGFAGYLGTVAIPWGVLSAFTAVSAAGVVAGTYLVRFISAAALKRAFAFFLLAIGALMLVQNRGAVKRAPASTPASAPAHG